jgi:hypothetical protein
MQFWDLYNIYIYIIKTKLNIQNKLDQITLFLLVAVKQTHKQAYIVVI